VSRAGRLPFQAARRQDQDRADGQRRWQVYREKSYRRPDEPAPGNRGYLAGASWLLECRLSAGEQVMTGDRPALRVDVARRDAQWSLPLTVARVVAQQAAGGAAQAVPEHPASPNTR